MGGESMTQQNADSLRIVDALGGSRSTGMCKCPLHDDSTASLHVSAGRKVAVIMKCHAGCPQQSLVKWAKEHRLWPNSQAMPKSTEGQSELKEQAERFRRAYSILRFA